MSPSDARNEKRMVLRASALGLLVGAAAWLYATWSPPLTGRLLFGGVRGRDAVLAAGCAWLAGFLVAASRGKRSGFRWLLASMACAGTWLAAEVVALALSSNTPAPPAIGWQREPDLDLRGETPPDIAHAWGLPHRPFSFHYQTNSWGYRNPKDRTAADVFCLGDSLLVAIQLPFSETIPGRLEAAIGRPVGNVCLIDKSPQELHECLRELPGLDLRGRMVVQFLCEDNDLRDSRSRAIGIKGRTQTSLADRTLGKRLLIALQRATQPEVAEARLHHGTWQGHDVWFFWKYDREPELEAQVPVILQSLTEFAQWVRDRGGRYGIVSIPQKLRVLGPFCGFPADSVVTPVQDHLTTLPEALREWSRRTGVPCLDAEPALTAVAERGELPWFGDDTHLTAAGHAAVTDAVLAWDWFRTAVAGR
jgi:hypothetical protein